MSKKNPVIDRQAVKDQAKQKARIARDKAQLARQDMQRAPSEPIPDPLADVDYEQGIEGSAQDELSAVLTGFQQRAKAERERFGLAVDSEFWVLLYFRSRQQKEEFLQALNWLILGDKYIDGCLLARQMGIDLTPVKLANKNVKPDRKLIPLALPKEEPETE